MNENELRAYNAGFFDALNNFAWWKDGVQYVGSGWCTLNKAIDDMKTLSRYQPRLSESSGSAPDEKIMGDKSRGLYSKFTVTRNDGKSGPGGKHEKCEYFVLDVSCDPHAIPALMAYAESCKEDYPLLAADVRRMAQNHCEHEWTDTLYGPDTIGEHCSACGTDGGDPDMHDDYL